MQYNERRFNTIINGGILLSNKYYHEYFNPKSMSNLIEYIKNNNIEFRLIPDEYKTIELCEQLTRSDILNHSIRLYSIPVKSRTVNVCALFCKYNKSEFTHVPIELRIHNKIKKIIAKHGFLNAYLPTITQDELLDFTTREIYFSYIGINYEKLHMYHKIKEGMFVYEKLKKIIKKNPMSILLCIDDLLTEELFKIAIINSLDVINYSIRYEDQKCQANVIYKRIPGKILTDDLNEFLLNLFIKNNMVSYIDITNAKSAWYLLKYDWHFIRKIPKHIITEEMCIYIGNVGGKVESMPMITKRIEMECDLNSYHIPKKYHNNEDDILYFLERKVQYYKELPDKFKTYEFICKIARRNGFILNYIDELLITRELIIIVLKQNQLAFEYIPNRFLFEEIYYIILNNTQLFRYLPDKCKTYEISKNAVEADGMNITDSIIKTKELVWIMINGNYNSQYIKYVPEELLDDEIIKTAIRKDVKTLYYISKDIKSKLSYDFYKEIVSIDGTALRWIPKEFKTYDICLLAVSKNGMSLSEVPKGLLDERMFLAAIKENIKAEQYIPRKKITTEIFKYLVVNDKISMTYLKSHDINFYFEELKIRKSSGYYKSIPLDKLKYRVIIDDICSFGLKHCLTTKVCEKCLFRYSKTMEQLKKMRELSITLFAPFSINFLQLLRVKRICLFIKN